MVDYIKILDDLEKKHRLISGGGHSLDRLSSGLLVHDLVMGGGILPGIYSISGPEQSAKSTQTFHLLKSAIQSKIPVIVQYDAEGSVHPDYLAKIFKTKNIDEVFGIKDLKGNYLVEPKARYVEENILEGFFRFIRDILRCLPEKVYLPEQKGWFLIYDDSKLHREILSKSGYKPIKSLSSRGATYVEAPDSKPQALIILDSWPMLMPEKYDEEEGGGSGMAHKARVMSEELSKTSGQVRKKGMVLYGVNQIRLKPGVMYGCFPYDTPVVLANGSTMKIGDIVENRVCADVRSFNRETGGFEIKRIVNWFNNGVAPESDFVHIGYRISGSEPNHSGPISWLKDMYYLCCTGNHKVWDPTIKQMKHACEFKIGDSLQLGGSIATVVSVGNMVRNNFLEKYDIEVEDNHTYMVGTSSETAVVVKNSPEYEPCGEALKYASAVRNQLKARAVPPGWPRTKGSSKTGEEPGVNGGTDTYAYKYITNIKNKYGTPYLGGWSRVWVSDRKGKAHGFDEVFDCFEYLSLTGQVTGSHTKQFTIDIDGKKLSLRWEEFKALVLSEDKKTPDESILKIFKRNKIKPFKLRQACFKQLKAGSSQDLLANAKDSADTLEDYEE